MITKECLKGHADGYRELALSPTYLFPEAQASTAKMHSNIYIPSTTRNLTRVNGSSKAACRQERVSVVALQGTTARRNGDTCLA